MKEKKFNLSILNDSQKKIILSEAKEIFVQAGPGTGKTFTLVKKIEYLIKEKDISPEKILAVSFTRKAAASLKEKLYNLNIYSGTIHSLCFDFLELFIENRDIILKLDKQQILNEIKERFVQDNISLSDIELLISLYKSDGKECSLIYKIQESEFDKKIKNLKIDKKLFYKIYNFYEKKKSEKALIDYDDLIILAYNNMGVQKSFLDEFEYIFCDEAQDLNLIQINFLIKLSQKRNIFLIGDINQSIYKFRGATPEFVNDLKTIYKDMKFYFLDVNYRNSRNIFSLGNEFVSENKEPNPYGMIKTENRFSEKIKFYNVKDNGLIGRLICLLIKSFVKGVDMLETDNFDNKFEISEQDIGLSDIAILFRKHKYARNLVKYLEKENIAYKWYNKEKYLETARRKNFFKFLIYTILDRKDTITLPKKFTGVKILSSLEKIIKLNDINMVINFLTDLFEIKDSDIWFYNFKYKLIAESGETDIKSKISKVLSEIEYEYEQDIKFQNQGVSLLTFHSSKGLEFKVVFIIGLEDYKSFTQEERRLIYVAITRAKDYLYIISKSEKPIFLNEVHNEYIHKITTDNFIEYINQKKYKRKQYIQKQINKKSQLDLF